MLSYLKERINGKKILVLGFGREGKSTLKTLLTADQDAVIAIADQKELTLSDPAFADEMFADLDLSHITFETGADYQKAIDSYDLIMKSPGIVLEKDITDYQAEIVSQMQLMFEFYKEQIIGITGTKGKSTTTTLIHHVLKSAGKKAILAGNIGIPVFDIIPEIEKDSILVLELSCHQLEYMTVSPKRGVLLNIYEEHLDHYGTVEKYVASKEKIYVNQTKGDVLFVNPSFAPASGRCKAQIKMVDIIQKAHADGSVDVFDDSDKLYESTADSTAAQTGVLLDVATDSDRPVITYGERAFVIPCGEISLLGEHNYYDIAFAYGMCCDMGVTDEAFLEGIKTYVPLPHRLQCVGTYDGVTYYDDSISTIDETTIQAIETIKNTDTILIGGMERNISYVNLESYLASSTVPHIILMEATGKRIAKEISENYPDFSHKERISVVEHLEDAVALAKQITRKGGACVLSPAAASYGIFKNFEERGDVFQRLVKG